MKVNLITKGNRIYIGKSLLYLVKYDNGGGYGVFDDGEYEGKYFGGLDRLKEMTEDEAVDYVWNRL